MKRHTQIFCLLFLLTANPVTADTKNIKVDIGGVTIDVKAPNEFHEVSSLSPETRKLAETMTPPANRLLAVFVSEEDLGRIMIGEAPVFRRYMLLQSSREFEKTVVPNSQFQLLTTWVKEQQDTLLNEVRSEAEGLIEGAAEKISKENDLSLQMKVGEQVPLGIFLEELNAVGLVSLVKYETEIEGEKLDYVVAGGSTYLLTKGKLLYAYVYSIYETQDDANWVRSKSKEWVNSLLTSNSTSISDSSYRSSSASGIDWDRVVRKGVIGFFMGGLLALLVGLFKGTKWLLRKNKDKT